MDAWQKTAIRKTEVIILGIERHRDSKEETLECGKPLLGLKKMEQVLVARLPKCVFICAVMKMLTCFFLVCLQCQ